MKKLTLIRHGEADLPGSGQTDIDRPLTRHGVQEASRIAQRLKDQGFSFDQLFCSTAQRALATAEIIDRALGTAARPFIADPALYDFEMDALYRFIELLDDAIEHAVIVAHNPALSYLANDLSRSPVQSLPTCAVVQLELNITDWVAVNARCGKLLAWASPEDS